MNFVLDKNTFLWEGCQQALFYNCANAKYKVVQFGNSQIRAFVRSILAIENFSVCKIDRDIMPLALALSREGFGRVVPEGVVDFQLSKTPLINTAVERIPEDKRKYIISNWFNLSLYVNSVTIYAGGESKQCDLYKQMPYPIDSRVALNVDSIVAFINEVHAINNSTRFNIAISDLKQFATYSFLHLSECITSLITLYVRKEVLDERLLELFIIKGFNVKVIVDSPTDFNESECLSDVSYVFLINSETALEKYEEISVAIPGIKMEPIYIVDDNAEFIKNTIFTTKQEILKNKATKQLIYTHQHINTFNWGKIYVLPNGEVCTDMIHHNKIGVISDNLQDLIAEEMVQNFAWRQIRKYETCLKCVCRWLCPSPTPYERLLNAQTICLDNSAEL